MLIFRFLFAFMVFNNIIHHREICINEILYIADDLSMKKVLIIGLDGFAWSVANTLFTSKSMPFLESILAESSKGVLRSIVPFETAPAWSSFQTGCRPGKTGIFGFHNYDRVNTTISLNNASKIDVPTLWSLLSKAGKRFVCINLPVTFPMGNWEGIMIPGLLAPYISNKTVYPPSIYNKYKKLFKRGYRVVNMNPAKSLDEFVQNQIQTEKCRFDIGENLIKTEKWDLFCYHIQSTDYTQHTHWWALDKMAEGFDVDAYKKITEIYKYCDSVIEKLFSLVDEDTLKIVVSDHGFCAQRANISLNSWLREKGYLCIVDKKPDSNFGNIKNKIKKEYKLVKLLACIYGKIVKYAYALLPKKDRSLNCEQFISHLRNLIHYENTQAFMLGDLAGMFYYIGKSSDRELICKEIIDGLLEDFGPNSSDRMIKEIIPATEFYGTITHSDVMPDFVIEFYPGVNNVINPTLDKIISHDLISKDYYKNKQHGTHSPEGIFIFNCKDVSKKCFEANIYDILPTILAYLDIPVPEYIDGKVLNEAFLQKFNHFTDKTGYEVSHTVDLSDNEQREVERKLNELGYI